MIQMITGGLVTQLIRVVAQLGVADVLAEGPKSSTEIAKLVGAHPHALYRVLRALASVGIFAETPDGHFGLTPLALPLQAAAPELLQALAIMWGVAAVAALRSITLQCSNGRSRISIRPQHGQLFDYLQQHPDAGGNLQCGNDQLNAATCHCGVACL